MASFYNRDAFADLMAQYAGVSADSQALGNTTGPGSGGAIEKVGNSTQNGAGKAFVGAQGVSPYGGDTVITYPNSQGDLFQNLADMGLFGNTGSSPSFVGPGFSVGNITSDIDQGSTLGSTSGFGVGDSGLLDTTVSGTGQVLNNSLLNNYGFQVGDTSALNAANTSFVGGDANPFVSLLRPPAPGEVNSYYPGIESDSHWARLGYTVNPYTNNQISDATIANANRFSSTTTGDTATTGGTGATTTDTGGISTLTTTGQTGANATTAGIPGSLDTVGGTIITTGTTGDDDTNLNTNLLTPDATEIVTTGTTDTDDELNTSLLTPDVTELVTTGTTGDDETKNLLASILDNRLVDAFTGGRLEEVISIGKAIKNNGFVSTALGALGLDSIDFGEIGGDFTFDDSSLTAYVDSRQNANTNIENVGSTGTGGAFDIANLAAIRSAVPGTYDPNRRAGSGGQRYFSDVQYAPQGGIAGSQAAANTQAMLLAYQNATNPAYQVRPGNATDRATSMAQRAAGLAGLLPTTVTGTIPTARTTTTATTGDTTTDTTGTTTDTTGATTGTTGATTDTTGATTGTTTATTGDTTPATTTPATTTYERLPEQTDLSYDFMSGLNAALAVEDPAVTEFKETLLNPEESTAIQAATTGPQQRTPTEILEDIAADTDDRISTQEQNAVASLLKSGQTDINTVNKILGVETYDILEGLLRGGYQTPAETAAMLQGYGNEGFTEEQLIANLLETGRATPEEISSYYGIPVEAITQRYTELGGTRQFAQGGDINGFYLGGATDGMADQIPATINNMQPAALSDGEFVIPADVVSHLGNGNSDSGAKELYSMMDRIRQDRTGTTKQGRQIDPNKYLA